MDAEARSAALRREHVDKYLRGRGLRDERVLKAMAEVPREAFAGDVPLNLAYADHPLPIGCDQTISQPFMVAWMTEVLEPRETDRVLEIGTGSGYQTAVLAELVDAVFTMEYHAALQEKARHNLEDLGCRNIRYKVGDGSLGWPEEGPYDGILVTAGAPNVPEALTDQLADDGRLVLPVGDRVLQTLMLVRKKKGRLEKKRLGGCRFVPLVGEQGWGREA